MSKQKKPASHFIRCGACGKKLKIWFSGFAALGRHMDDCPGERKKRRRK